MAICTRILVAAGMFFSAGACAPPTPGLAGHQPTVDAAEADSNTAIAPTDAVPAATDASDTPDHGKAGDAPSIADGADLDGPVAVEVGPDAAIDAPDAAIDAPDAALDPPECASATDCPAPKDSNPCETAQCLQGKCVVDPKADGTPCKIPSGCIAVGSCKSGQCVSTGDCCDDNLPCTKDIYYWLDQSCHHSVLPLCKPICADAGDCNDEDACTTDGCSAAKTCTFVPITGCKS